LSVTMVKDRIDLVLVRKGLAESREKARLMVMLGKVYVDGERVAKPDKRIEASKDVEIREDGIPFVGFGAIKLSHAIRSLGISVDGKVAVDIGSSTGGFVECLLLCGAQRVYAIDVGRNLLHEKLRRDPRVVVKEGINARYLEFEHIGEYAHIVTVDVSFISLKKIIPVTRRILKPGGILLSLLKPQFEVGRFEVGRGGIVRDGTKVQRVIEEIRHFGEKEGFRFKDIVESEREHERKNREYFMLWEFPGIQDQ